MECTRTACSVYDHNLVLMKECQKTCFSMCHIFILYIITIPVLASSRMEVLKLFSKVWVLMQRNNREREKKRLYIFYDVGVAAVGKENKMMVAGCGGWGEKEN